MDSSFENFAYQDNAFPIQSDQTISQPFIVAYQSERLEIKPKEKILEIGTGSGYQTAVLLELGARVFTIERQKTLYLKAKNLLPKLGYTPEKIIFGDGYIGMEEEAPFDKIIVTAGAEHLPKKLLAQLKIGGKLIIPLGKTEQIMTLYTRNGTKEFSKEELIDCRFVPMLKNTSTQE